MSSHLDDRRAGRTREAREAARRLLESVARRNQLSALALASENGSLVTGVGDGCDLDWLASQAAIHGAGRTGGEGASPYAGPAAARRLRCFSMAIGPYLLHVGAFGLLDDCALPIEECDAGLRRIYEPLFCCAA